MKKVVIVCNRPLSYISCIRDLQKRGVIIEQIVSYIEFPYKDPTIVMSEIQKFKRTIAIKAEIVENQMDFLDIIDRLYSDPDIIFLMDLNLCGGYYKYFWERTNVKYAELHKNDGRIYFFTTMGRDYVAMLSKKFPGHVIYISTNDTYVCDKKQLFWEESKIISIMEKENPVKTDYEILSPALYSSENLILENAVVSIENLALKLQKKEPVKSITDRWIPCKEELPVIGEIVILSLSNYEVYFGFRENVDKSFNIAEKGTSVEFKDVLAWKPRPEPYREPQNLE